MSVDRKLGSEVYPLAYPDDYADEIYASHVLEHVPQAEVVDVLKEWVRVLKPGCQLFVSVPDFDKIKAKSNKLWFKHLMGGQVDDDDYHRSVFDNYILATSLVEAGLEELSEWRSSQKDCSSNPVSLNMTGRKPKRKPTTK